LSNRDQSV